MRVRHLLTYWIATVSIIAVFAFKLWARGDGHLVVPFVLVGFIPVHFIGGWRLRWPLQTLGANCLVILAVCTTISLALKQNTGGGGLVSAFALIAGRLLWEDVVAIQRHRNLQGPTS